MLSFLVCFIIFILSVVLCTLMNWPVVIALFFGYCCFFLSAVLRGTPAKSVTAECAEQVRQVKPLLNVLLLLGAMTASWRACGTLAMLVYYGTEIITPSLFIVTTFAATSVVAYMIGTSFGVAGIMGTVFMTIGAAGEVNPLLTAGALFSGIYFGDRTSPISSSFLTIQSITGYSSLQMVKGLLKDAMLPMIGCLLIYGVLSVMNPLKNTDMTIIRNLADTFIFSPWMLLPAVIMLLFPVLRLDSLKAMLLSAGSACIVAVSMQDITIAECLTYVMKGYVCRNSDFGSMLNGGGVLGMVEICLIVCISVSLLPVMQKCGMEELLNPLVMKSIKKLGRTATAVLLVILANLIFCNQTVSLYLAEQCMKDSYDKNDVEEFIKDVSDSNIVGGLVPWSVSCAVPLALMGAEIGCIMFAFYIWMQPAIRCLLPKWIIKNRTCNVDLNKINL